MTDTNSGSWVKAGAYGAAGAAFSLVALVNFTYERPDNGAQNSTRLGEFTQTCLMENVGAGALNGETGPIATQASQIDQAWLSACIQEKHDRDIVSDVPFNRFKGGIAGIFGLLLLGVGWASSPSTTRASTKREPVAP